MHKGLLLVSIPLCFELGIFTLLLSLQNDMAQESARINNARMIGDSVNRISHRAMILEDAFRNNANPLEVARSIQTGMTEWTKQFEQLEELTRNDLALHTIVLRSIAQLDAAKKDLAELKAHLMENFSGDTAEAARSFGPRFRYRLRMVVSAGLLELAANSAREIDTDRTTAMRNKIVLLLKIAVAFSAMIAAVGAWVFSQHMISRLKVAMTNADRLGARKPLLRPIGGNDEIAELDHALHNAANLITGLERAREEVIGMVSHDIRNPLSTIKATGELLKGELQDNENDRSKELINIIDSNCNKVLRISKDLLDLQRLESGTLTLDKSSTNLKECLLSAASATEAMQRAYGVDVEPELESVHANVDEDRIEQVVTNLLTNAIKFSPKKSKVRLTLSETTNQQVCIRVIDQGNGIPDDMKTSVFNRFAQVNREDSKRGSGLGLAISKALVELHGGKIGVSDASPTGCDFWILLPKGS